MTTTEIIQELINTINDLTIRVNGLSNQLNTLTLTVNRNYNYTTEDIDELTVNVNSLMAEDNDLHHEIHDVSQNLSYTYIQTQSNTLRLNTLNNSYLNLVDTVTSNKAELDDEDVELHREIHVLSNNTYAYLTDYSSKINNINLYLTEVPQHVLLTETQYEDITNPNPAKYYFVYEEE